MATVSEIFRLSIENSMRIEQGKILRVLKDDSAQYIYNLLVRALSL
jgi:hypothetical protein